MKQAKMLVSPFFCGEREIETAHNQRAQQKSAHEKRRRKEPPALLKIPHKKGLYAKSGRGLNPAKIPGPPLQDWLFELIKNETAILAAFRNGVLVPDAVPVLKGNTVIGNTAKKCELNDQRLPGTQKFCFIEGFLIKENSVIVSILKGQCQNLKIPDILLRSKNNADPGL